MKLGEKWDMGHAHGRDTIFFNQFLVKESDIGHRTRHYFNFSWVKNHLLAFKRKF
jgi:hypothetical protein